MGWPMIRAMAPHNGGLEPRLHPEHSLPAPREQAGMSLIEILATGLLLGVLLLVAAPSLFAPPTLDVEPVTRQLAADLRLARALAISDRASYEVAFVPAGGPYTSYSVARQGGAAEADFPKSFPSGVSVIGIDQVTFSPSGAATPSGTITFTLTSGGVSAQLAIVAATGRVRVIGP